MGDYGFKVSKSGFDVTTAGDKDLAFSSSFNTFKIGDPQKGSWTVASSTQFGQKTITLTGYTIPPVYSIFISVNGNNYYVNNGGFIENVDGTNDLFLSTYVDNSATPVLYIEADINANPLFTSERIIKYYLYLGIDDI
ncbi:MAG: hypothetical protein ACTSQE_07365 [Candidatus Heimdallarchaeaceae archaeon]